MQAVGVFVSSMCATVADGTAGTPCLMCSAGLVLFNRTPAAGVQQLMWVICGGFVTAVVWLYACRRMIAWSACRMILCLVCRSAVQHVFLCRNALRQGWCHMCAVLPAGGKHSSHSGCYFDADRDVAPAPEPAVLLASGCRACCCSTVGFASASPLAQLSSCRACHCISVILWCAFIPGVLCFYSAAIGHHVDTCISA